MDDEFEYGPDVLTTYARDDNDLVERGADRCPSCGTAWTGPADVTRRDGPHGRTYYCRSCMMMHRGVLDTSGMVACQRRSDEPMQADLPDWEQGRSA